MWRAYLAGDKRANWFRLWSLVVLEDWMERNGMER
jgi:hypothetical protein